jgi:coniferyl-aldehyde dehydrogenase
MAKFSEVTSRTADVFAKKVGEYFDPTELTVITGGPEVGAQFSELPFDHIFFTGSPQVGAKVASAAARNLVPVTLELGGKNPAVVAESADVNAAAQRIMAARLVNGGQLCLCPDYAFVPRDKLDEFVRAALQRAGTAAAADDGTGLVSIVDDRNYERVTSLIDDAREHGASVKQAPAPDHHPVRRIPPTVLLDVTDSMRISTEEVFGPVLAVYPYESLDTVIGHIQARSTPLAAYWYGPTGADFASFRRNVASGGMTVNDFAAHNAVPGAPFGGLGGSGWGAYHGKVGFDTFSHRRTITTSKFSKSLADVLAPPYPRGALPMVRAFIGLQRRAASRRIKRNSRVRSTN